MATPKTLICRCEDITADDVVHAIRDGFATFEDLKRYLGVATGPCQGKACVQACMQQVAAHRGIPMSEVDVMTFRPPVRPVPFATLAAPDAEPGAAGVPFGVPPPRLRTVEGDAAGSAAASAAKAARAPQGQDEGATMGRDG
ncbi:MAG TPA: (2Fe-2S)-binding protein [Candidatus Thermoplasmatota archaeon]|nr:(2Fe-2S)-binding protein [Candidatus Thermoplasmatota archaeon]